MTKTSPVVVNSVSKSFKKHVVLDNVSLQVEKKEIFGLIGIILSIILWNLVGGIIEKLRWDHLVLDLIII